jgi:hypothetical protein
MLNMGGPSSLHGPRDGVQAFLTNLFSDPEIIPLGPLQKLLVCTPSAVLSLIVKIPMKRRGVSAGTVHIQAAIAENHSPVRRDWRKVAHIRLDGAART